MHHRLAANGVELHCVTAGGGGPPMVLLHGFPKSWWAFHKLIPHLARDHRVVAVDLRGFGDSQRAGPDDDSGALAEDVRALVDALGFGPVHLVVQDISGAIGLRLACLHPDALLSLAAIETGFAGFGLEALADVAHGGAWHIGALATPGVAETFFQGREASLVGDFILRASVVDPAAVSADDVSEFARGYARDGGWSGAHALYASMLREGDALRSIVRRNGPRVPILAVDRGGSNFTSRGVRSLQSGAVRAATVDGVGHAIALEAPERLAAILRSFAAGTVASRPT